MFNKLIKKKREKTEEKREENHFNLFIELLLEHVTVNETGAFRIPPDKVDKGHFVYTLSFTVLAC